MNLIRSWRITINDRSRVMDTCSRIMELRSNHSSPYGNGVNIMMAGPPEPSTFSGDDQPIHCYYCNGESTMDKIRLSPDGHAACIDCYKERFPAAYSDKDKGEMK